MGNHSEASRLQVDIRIPAGFRLVSAGDELKKGDLWFNFAWLKWEKVHPDFIGRTADHYVACRTLTVISEDELPEELRC